MTKFATALIAAMFAFATPANAQRTAAVGDIIDFNSPIVGCSKWEDAYKAMTIRTYHGSFAEADFGREMARWYLQRNDYHFCAVFGDLNDRSGWRIVRMHRTQYTGPNDIWICIEPENNDLRIGRPRTEQEEEAERKNPNRYCYWTFIHYLTERK